MPWNPEWFSASFLANLRQGADTGPARAVPYFDGLLSGDVDALVRSFAGVPELHHPVRGRVRGERAFRAFVGQARSELTAQHASWTPVNVIVTERRTVEEVVLHLEVDGTSVALPVAVATDRLDDGRLEEVRVYFSTWPLTGGHANRPPLLQRDPDVHEGDIVGVYQRALAAGDVEATVATFEPDGTMREPAGDEYVHRGEAGLRELFTLFFSNGGGIPLEHCTVTDDGVACALEYNVVQWGRTPMPPEAGVAVYARGASGKLVAGRVYDDSNPPLGH